MLIHCSGWYFGKDLIPEVGVAVECQTKSDDFSTNVTQLSSKIFDKDFTPAIETVGCQSKPIKFYSVIGKVNFISATTESPHLYHGVKCSGNGWGFGCDLIPSNIAEKNEKYINAERGGLATLLFQDSDHHLGNEAYVSNGNQYSYIRLDVDHADFIYAPLLYLIQDANSLRETLVDYKFSCNALEILSEILADKGKFEKSILSSLDNISALFSDSHVSRIYTGQEGFQADYDNSRYYKSINIPGNQGLKKRVLDNFDKIFTYAQASLEQVQADHSFALLGEVCNSNGEL